MRGFSLGKRLCLGLGNRSRKGRPLDLRSKSDLLADGHWLTNGWVLVWR